MVALLLTANWAAAAQEASEGVHAAPPQAEDLAARRRAKAEQLAPEQVPVWEARIRRLFEENRPPISFFRPNRVGLHAAIGGMPSGSGFVVGLGELYGVDDQPIRVSAAARVSTKGFTQYDAAVEYPPPQNRPPVRGFVRGHYHDYSEVRVHALGNGSPRGPRGFYGELRRYGGGGVIVEPSRAITLRAEMLRLTTTTDAGSRRPSAAQVFGPAQLPGLEGAAEYNVFGGQADLDLTSRWIFPAVGVRGSAGAWRYQQVGDDEFSFSRLTAEVSAHVPLGYPSRRAVVRLRTSQSSADAGARVPFFQMETLGGASSIRGYPEYRFRDTRNLLLNAEYQWEVWTYASLAFFLDAGKVFSDPGDLDFRGLHTGYGLGIRVHTPGTQFNIDLARSREGFKLHIGGGPRF